MRKGRKKERTVKKNTQTHALKHAHNSQNPKCSDLMSNDEMRLAPMSILGLLMCVSVRPEVHSKSSKFEEVVLPNTLQEVGQLSDRGVSVNVRLCLMNLNAP